ncbi:MAG: hypothetical protein M3209_16140 [Acidobacteriota bacterium]|nr:hypothetical protein [Acidobacteriota bacterium]
MNFRRFIIVALMAFSSLPVLAQSQNRSAVWKEIESLREQIKARENVLLDPAAEDRATYAEFLQQPDTGLIRLMPREKYDNKLTTRGGGAYYSFSRLTHEYGYGSDISLEQGDLSVGFAGADYGMIAKLGDVRIEDVTLENPIVRQLAQHKPPTTEPEARVEYRKISEDSMKKDAVFKRRMTAIAGNTYVLRSINYGTSDVLVAFEIIRQDNDDSLILAWKMLKKYPTPRLER